MLTVGEHRNRRTAVEQPLADCLLLLGAEFAAYTQTKFNFELVYGTL